MKIIKILVSGVFSQRFGWDITDGEELVKRFCYVEFVYKFVIIYTFFKNVITKQNVYTTLKNTLKPFLDKNEASQFLKTNPPKKSA